MSWVLIAHAAATFALFGLIWTIQLVHYPMFPSVRREEFGRWHAVHTVRISFLVVPLMGIEAVTAALLCAAPPAGVPPPLTWLGAGLVLVHLASTAFLQVPLHRRLSTGYDDDAARALVTTNWIRTAAWTLRAALVLSLL